MKEIKFRTRVAILISIPVLAFVFLFFIAKETLILSLIITGVILGIISVPFTAEAFSDRRNSIPPTEEAVRNKQEEYLRFREKYSYSRPLYNSMEKDLRRFFHNKIVYLKLGITISALAVIILIRKELSMTIFIVGLLICANYMYGGISRLLDFAVKRFLKANSSHIDEINDSYMNGSMVIDECEAINIGQEYLVMVHGNSIKAAKRENVESAGMLRERVKNYAEGLYAGEDINYYIYIQIKNTREPVKILLGEMKMQAAFEELQRLGYPVSRI